MAPVSAIDCARNSAPGSLGCAAAVGSLACAALHLLLLQCSKDRMVLNTQGMHNPNNLHIHTYYTTTVDSTPAAEQAVHTMPLATCDF
jgi:hypothetical protein